jgi:hypothetical protein
MKRFISTLALAAGFCGAAFAQNAANTPERPSQAQLEASKKQMAESMAERMSRDFQQKYGLSEEQYKKTLQANLVFSQKMIENRNPTGRTVTPAENQAIMDERDAKMKSIMTPEQYKQYDMVKPTAMPRNSQAPNH